MTITTVLINDCASSHEESGHFTLTVKRFLTTPQMFSPKNSYREWQKQEWWTRTTGGSCQLSPEPSNQKMQTSNTRSTRDIHRASNSFGSFYFQELNFRKKKTIVPSCNKPNPAVYPCWRVPQWCSVLAPPPTRRTPSDLSALGFEPRTLCVSVDYMLYITRMNIKGKKFYTASLTKLRYVTIQVIKIINNESRSEF